MPRSSDARGRIVRSAAALFQRQGYDGTSWREVIRAGDAPWGSQAHYFPGGKEQLGVDALTLSGERYERLLRAVLADVHPADAVLTWSTTAAAELERTGWTAGCPVATVALEQAGRSDELAAACSGAFDRWRAALADALEAAGLDRDDAQSLGMLVLAAIEGALLLARAAHDAAPLHTVGAELAAVVRERVD
jgi:TetR/AcrR family transcriptional regulator, lmrAB and yxaGH operons repressor